jgi:hypothetical protein
VAEAEAAEVALGRPNAPPSEIVAGWEESPAADPRQVALYAWDLRPSAVTGQPYLHYRRGELHAVEVPWYHRSHAARTLPRPRGYLVMPGWPQIEERLRGHGLELARVLAPAEIEVETLRLAGPHYAAEPYQGLTRLGATATRQREKRRIPAGALWIPADQPDFELAVQLLEPEAPDSLFAWGLLSTVLEQKEYIAPGVLEDHVARLLEDPAQSSAWRQALAADPKLAADPQARYLWWFRRTPWWDDTVGLLPYYRLLEVPRLELGPRQR